MLKVNVERSCQPLQLRSTHLPGIYPSPQTRSLSACVERAPFGFACCDRVSTESKKHKIAVMNGKVVRQQLAWVWIFNYLSPITNEISRWPRLTCHVRNRRRQLAGILSFCRNHERRASSLPTIGGFVCSCQCENPLRDFVIEFFVRPIPDVGSQRRTNMIAFFVVNNLRKTPA